jgi:hypothetical protein
MQDRPHAHPRHLIAVPLRLLVMFSSRPGMFRNGFSRRIVVMDRSGAELTALISPV